MIGKKDVFTATIRLNEEKQKELVSYFDSFKIEPPTPYIEFAAKKKDCAVSLYKKEDSEGLKKAVFQGADAEKEARRFSDEVVFATKLTPEKKAPFKFFTQIGSDEVGTGDFFGPVVVCAAFCDREMLSLIEKYGITDSKKLTDEYIKEVVPKLLLKADFSSLTLENEKFNDLHLDGLNLNAMKAKMHNRALLNLKKRHIEARPCIDQFAEEKTYYSYLKEEDEILDGIYFLTKGETHFPSVALASCIARYHFLEKMEEMGKKYGLVFPLGAGPKVDEFAKKFVNKFGINELKKVAKMNFKNATRI